MKPPVILLLTADPVARCTVQNAVLQSRHGLRALATAPEAFAALQADCSDIDLAIIDLDPGLHGQALFEAAVDRLPVLVLTSLEQARLAPIVQQRGAVGCLGKPFTERQLLEAISLLARSSPLEPAARP